jgi:hypothetical protein
MANNYARNDSVAFVNNLLNLASGSGPEWSTYHTGTLFLETSDLGRTLAHSDLTGHGGVIGAVMFCGECYTWDGSAWR